MKTMTLQIRSLKQKARVGSMAKIAITVFAAGVAIFLFPNITPVLIGVLLSEVRTRLRKAFGISQSTKKQP